MSDGSKRTDRQRINDLESRVAEQADEIASLHAIVHDLIFDPPLDRWMRSLIVSMRAAERLTSVEAERDEWMAKHSNLVTGQIQHSQAMLGTMLSSLLESPAPMQTAQDMAKMMGAAVGVNPDAT